MTNIDCSEGFCGIGHWQGIAEVYDGHGRFLGNGADQRHVRTLQEDGRTRIDLSFVGPLKFAGHYYIANKGDYRLYQGPANCGFAESLANDGVTANAYWPVTGLTQKFFLIATPDGLRQMSLALMSRGEQLLYVVVAEHGKVIGDQPQVEIPFTSGGCYDLHDDPKAGRDDLLLHRPGSWTGELRCQRDQGGQRQPVGCQAVRQTYYKDERFLRLTWAGGAFLSGEVSTLLTTNDFQAWSELGPMVGSYTLYGGRAMSGHFHHLASEQRVWRREVVSADGAYKAVVNLWYRGEDKLGAEWGVLKFTPLP